MNLKEAQKKNKIKEFIKERGKRLKGDKETFDKTLKSISSSQKSKSIQETSPQHLEEILPIRKG